MDNANAAPAADSALPALFDGEGEIFTRLAPTAKIYGEYGMGLSTRWVLAHTQAHIRAVDTSREWVTRVRASAGPTDRLEARWVDVGPIGDWGMPLGFTHRQNFLAYCRFIWDAKDTPDLVLIDGRFRVACFLTTLLHAAPGTRIIFDDYVARPYYHLVEELVPVTEANARQALFVTPETFARQDAEALRDQFLFVRD